MFEFLINNFEQLTWSQAFYFSIVTIAIAWILVTWIKEE